ncbi:MAG: DNA repair protein RadA [Pseudomonadota bacterium]
MRKANLSYICQECGMVHARWAGRCSGCQAWSSLTEQKASPANKRRITGAATRSPGMEVVALADANPASIPRPAPTGIAEFDRVCGGGFTPGSATLIGGEPGIGKSTLLLQIALKAPAGAVYITGEESLDQVRTRATRLSGTDKLATDLSLAAETDISAICRYIQAHRPALVVIDSIQTVYSSDVEGTPGSVAQVRTCAFELISVCKSVGSPLVMIGHVTKEGTLAGPRVLEHLVDTVLYFEGDRSAGYRILRGIKNRFGALDEIGIFEMTGTGLAGVANPSHLFMAERSKSPSPGIATVALLEGSRAILADVQALVCPTSFATPRRSVVGWDSNRLAMVTAVLDTHCGMSLGACDIYLNVAGGLRIKETAADLAVAAVLTSAAVGAPLPTDTVIFGEASLTGEIRPVGQALLRLKEAERLGFAAAMTPTLDKVSVKATALRISPVTKLSDFVYDMQQRPDQRENADGRR